jgi:predicted MFS family arabinose efflux permease
MAMSSVVPILLITHLPPVPFYWATAVSALFMVTISARMVPSVSLVTSVVPPHLRGSFMSLNTSIQNFSSGSASFIGGLLVATAADGSLLHYDRVGFVAIAFTAVAVLFSLPVERAVQK